MLKQLRYAKQLEMKRSKLNELITREQEYKQKAEELEAAINEAETEEDIALVDELVEELEAKKTELEAEKVEVEAEIAEVEAKLEEINNQAEKVTQENNETKTNEKEERGNVTMTNKYFETRSVKDFYEQLKGLKERSVGGEGLQVPNEVINKVMVKVADYASVYPLVNKEKVKGTARILLDTDETGATWMEMTGTFAEDTTGSITNVDFDGFKLGKLTTIDNAYLQDSIINLDEYVTKKLAKAIAKSLDAAILNGTGSVDKQPEGIITKLAAGNKVTVPADSLASVVAPIGLIDSGETEVAPVVAVMNRKTYYNRILALNVGTNSDGQIVGAIPNLAKPTILGLDVVFSAHMTEDKVLYGDFSQYTLVEREDITIEKSTHAKFAADQLAIRGKGRFDGKPTNADAFVLVTLTPVV
ncbi:phage major capsid protein [Lysinibacillus sp. FSL K6-4013]|uniref:phage major capsid protein n=1 Tax=Lysinibacillus sp. FSL K6-4013 TaxID=2921504 RepID=UPI00315B103D